MVDKLWWVGFALSIAGLLLLTVTTIFDLPLVPGRFRPHAFWLALLILFAGLSLSVVFT